MELISVGHTPPAGLPLRLHHVSVLTIGPQAGSPWHCDTWPATHPELRCYLYSLGVIYVYTTSRLKTIERTKNQISPGQNLNGGICNNI